MSSMREDEQAYRAAIAAGDDWAWDGLGRVLAAQAGRAEEAEAAFRTAIAKGDVMAWNSLGWLLTGQPGREQEAEAAYRRAIAAGNVFAPSNLGYLLRRQPGREHEAEAVYREALAAGIVELWSHLGALLAGLQGREAEADDAYRRAIATGNRGAWRGLGRMLAVQPGRADEAECAYREAIAAGDAQAARDLTGMLMDKGLVLHRGGQHEDAIVVFDAVISQFATDADPGVAWRVAWAFVDKGLALQQLERPADAVVAFQEAHGRVVALAERDEDLFAAVLFGMCDTLRQPGRHEDVLQTATLALEQFCEAADEGSSRRDRCARALMVKGNALRELGDLDGAIAVYEDVAARFIDDGERDVRRRVAWALVDKSELLYDDGRHEDALQAAEVLLDRFGATTDDDQRARVHRALCLKADALRWVDRAAEALVVYDSAIALAQRLGAQLDEPVYGEWATRNLFEKASILRPLGRAEQAVADRERAFALIEPAAPAWMHEHLGLALIAHASDLQFLGEHDRAAQVPNTTIELLGGALETDVAPERPPPSEERLAELLAETLGGDCFEHFAAPADDRPRELYAAHAVALYRATAPVIAALAQADDDSEDPAFAAAMIVRVIAAAFALLSRSGALDERVVGGLPTPARVALAIKISGLDHWAEDHRHALPPLVDDDEAWDAIAETREAAAQLEFDEAAFTPAFANALRTYDVVAAIRRSRDGRDVMRTPRVRDHVIDQIASCLHWMQALEHHEPDALPLVLTMLQIAECFYVAAFTDAPLHDEWFPSRAFLRDLLDAPDGLSDLIELGVELPAWLR